MKFIGAFFQLLRWPNLVFIALTQILFYYFVMPLGFVASTPGLSSFLFYCVLMASVTIAAAGYIINDYYDVEIDAINKASRLVIGVHISKPQAVFAYILLSVSGLLLSIYVGIQLQNLLLPLLNFIVILLLWFYSALFKKKLLIGNVIISLLTAWVILVLPVADYDALFRTHEGKMLWIFAILYAAFAFVVSLAREVVKDLEDSEGDAQHGCTTLPIVFGAHAARIFAAVCLLLLIFGVLLIQLNINRWYIAVYSFLFLIFPLILALVQLSRATKPAAFHKISSLIKIIMLAGIFTMLFFYIY